MTQKQRVKEYLESGGALTRLNAWQELGVIEAPARISELRDEGMLITTKRLSVKNRYGESVSIAEWRIKPVAKPGCMG